MIFSKLLCLFLLIIFSIKLSDMDGKLFWNSLPIVQNGLIISFQRVNVLNIKTGYHIVCDITFWTVLQTYSRNQTLRVASLRSKLHRTPTVKKPAPVKFKHPQKVRFLLFRFDLSEVFNLRLNASFKESLTSTLIAGVAYISCRFPRICLGFSDSNFDTRPTFSSCFDRMILFKK